MTALKKHQSPHHNKDIKTSRQSISNTTSNKKTRLF